MMSGRRIFAVARLNALLQTQEPSVPVLMAVIPIVLTPFMIPGNRMTLVAEGYMHATGAEQAVPGFAVLFSFFSVQLIVQMFFDEQQWGTWNRMRASAASMSEIILGKVAVAFIMQFAQMAVVLAFGMVLDGYRPDGSMLALIMVTIIFALMVAMFGVAIAMWCGSERTAISVAMLGCVLMACLGGSLTAVSTFPDWARPLTRFSPAYWAVDAIKRIGLDRAGVADVLPQIGVIGGFGALFVVASIIGFYRKSRS
jgi:ABC-2 type transport system permease protein